MRSDRHLPLLRSPRMIALAIVVMSCGSRDTRVSCSPTPSCSIDADRFEPPPDEADAGVPSCDQARRRCAAEQIAAGRAHTCGITPAGELLCWGDNSEGQLGPEPALFEGDRRDGRDAGLRPALGGAQAVAAGDGHTCAIGAEGAVLCWGRNAEGQVIGEASGPVVVPQVAVGPVALDIAAGGAHSCALVEGEGVRCWGSGRHGQCGRELAEVLVPGTVPGTEDAIQVSAGTRHSCALLGSGRVLCWGELHDDDAGAMRAVVEPREVPGLDDAAAIAAGAGFTCALRPAGQVVCWGNNGSGQLGDGTHESSATPVAVLELELALDIGAGGAELDGELVGHACAITRSFFVQCWGRNAEAQLGQVPSEDVPRAVVVQGEQGEEDDEPFLPDVTAIAVGGFHACAIDHDGPVLCWGDDRLQQLSSEEAMPAGFPAEVRLFTGDY